MSDAIGPIMVLFMHVRARGHAATWFRSHSLRLGFKCSQHSDGWSHVPAPMGTRFPPRDCTKQDGARLVVMKGSGIVSQEIQFASCRTLRGETRKQAEIKS